MIFESLYNLDFFIIVTELALFFIHSSLSLKTLKQNFRSLINSKQYSYINKYWPGFRLSLKHHCRDDSYRNALKNIHVYFRIKKKSFKT